MNQAIFSNETVMPQDRTKFIGGSDVAAIMGLSPWKTPVKVWQEKTGRVSDEERKSARSKKENLYNRGHRWEQPAFEMLCEALLDAGHEVVEIAASRRYSDAEHTFLSCEIDREIMFNGEAVNVEIKTVHPFAASKWGEMDTDEIPIEYATQVMHGLGITRRRMCIVGCLIGADNIVPYFVERDDATIASMRAQCVKFWHDHVLADVAPDPINFQDLSVLFSKDDGSSIEATESILLAVDQLRAIKQKIKVDQERADELQFQIENFMQPAATLTIGGKKLATCKTQMTTRFDKNSFGDQHPDLLKKFNVVSESRVFRLAK
jgi:putative phage-type endonuclease